MPPEAPEPGAARARCGECSAWHPMHYDTCSKFVPERHSRAQNLFVIEHARAIHLEFLHYPGDGKRITEPMTAQDLANAAVHQAMCLLKSLVDAGHL